MTSSIQANSTPIATRGAYVEDAARTTPVTRAKVWSVNSDRAFPPGVLGVTTRVHDDDNRSAHSPMSLHRIQCFNAPVFFNA